MHVYLISGGNYDAIVRILVSQGEFRTPYAVIAL
jgi:hypothetical protein